MAGLVLFEEVVDAVVFGFLGVVLDLAHLDIVHEQVVDLVGLEVGTEASHLQVVLLVGEQVAAPFGFLRAQDAVVAVVQ